MSFFEVMKRMMAGQPAFENKPESSEKSENMADVPNQPMIRKGDDSSFPVVFIKSVKTNLHGNAMDVYAQIVNNWPEQIMLDKIRLGGATREIDNFLQGGEQREFLIYNGPTLQKECFEAQLDYKTQHEGDYFEAIHDVKCTYLPESKTYSIDEMRLRRPIRDIYG